MWISCGQMTLAFSFKFLNGYISYELIVLKFMVIILLIRVKLEL